MPEPKGNHLMMAVFRTNACSKVRGKDFFKFFCLDSFAESGSGIVHSLFPVDKHVFFIFMKLSLYECIDQNLMMYTDRTYAN